MNYRRRCGKCSTPLPGRKGHGFIVKGLVLCYYCNGAKEKPKRESWRKDYERWSKRTKF